jgi:hypothetical protein
MDVAIRGSQRPGPRRLAYLCAVLADITAGRLVSGSPPRRIPADARMIAARLAAEACDCIHANMRASHH